VIDVLSFTSDVGVYSELIFKEVNLIIDGRARTIGGRQERQVLRASTPDHGVAMPYWRWSSNQPVKMEEGTVISGEIESEVLVSRYLLDYLYRDTVIKSDELCVTVDEIDLTNTKKDAPTIVNDKAVDSGQWYRVRVSIANLADYGITPEEADFVRRSAYQSVMGKKLDTVDFARSKNLAKRMPRLRFLSYGEAHDTWRSSTPGKRCEKCVSNTHASLLEALLCKQTSAYIPRPIERAGFDAELLFQGERDGVDIFPVGMMVNKYMLKTTPFRISCLAIAGN